MIFEYFLMYFNIIGVTSCVSCFGISITIINFDKMKKLLLVLICSSFCCLNAQTTEEAIQFLKVNCQNWACEKIAIGSLQERLEISLFDNDKYLKLREKMPDYPYKPGGYKIIKINLSLVTQISINNNGGCSGINIQTKPYGIEMDWYSNEGDIIKNSEYWNLNFDKKGWVVDSIRIKAWSDDFKGDGRIVKALKFLAKQNGSVITESNF